MRINDTTGCTTSCKSCTTGCTTRVISCRRGFKENAKFTSDVVFFCAVNTTDDVDTGAAMIPAGDIEGTDTAGAAVMVPDCRLECSVLTLDDYIDLLITTVSEFPGNFVQLLGAF